MCQILVPFLIKDYIVYKVRTSSAKMQRDDFEKGATNLSILSL